MAKKVTEIRLEFPDDAMRSAFESEFKVWLTDFQKRRADRPESVGGDDVHRIGYTKPNGGTASPEILYVDCIPGW